MNQPKHRAEVIGRRRGVLERESLSYAKKKQQTRLPGVFFIGVALSGESTYDQRTFSSSEQGRSTETGHGRKENKAAEGQGSKLGREDSNECKKRRLKKMIWGTKKEGGGSRPER